MDKIILNPTEIEAATQKKFSGLVDLVHDQTNFLCTANLEPVFSYEILSKVLIWI